MNRYGIIGETRKRINNHLRSERQDEMNRKKMKGMRYIFCYLSQLSKLTCELCLEIHVCPYIIYRACCDIVFNRSKTTPVS